MRLTSVLAGVALGLMACKGKSDDKPATKPVAVADAAVAAPSSQVKGVDLPRSGNSPVDAPPEEAVMITVTPKQILVEGEPIVDVADGKVPAADKTAGKYGIEITPLRDVLRKHGERMDVLARHRGFEDAGAVVAIKLGHHEATLVADRATNYGLLTSVIYSAGQAEFSSFQVIVAKPDGKLGALHVSLPVYDVPTVGPTSTDVNGPTGPGGDLAEGIRKAKDEQTGPSPGAPARPRAVPPPAAPPAPLPLQMVVSVVAGQLVLFSLSGEEGKLEAPLVKLPAKTAEGYDFDLAPLATAVVAVAGRHPSKEPRAIILIADTSAPLQTIVDVMLAVRAAADGSLLFPQVVLAAGIQ